MDSANASGMFDFQRTVSRTAISHPRIFLPIVILVTLQRILKSFALHPFSKNTLIFLMKILFVRLHSLLVRLSFFLNLWKRFFLVTYRIDDDDDWQEGVEERMCGTHEARNALQEQGSLLVEKSVVRFFSSRLKKANFPRVLKNAKKRRPRRPVKTVVHERWYSNKS